MKIAAVDHFLNPGGGSRVLGALLPALKQCRPDVEITLFGNTYGIERDRFVERLAPLGIKVQKLRSTWVASGPHLVAPPLLKAWSIFLRFFGRKLSWLPPLMSGAVHRELEQRLVGYDLAFFSWPFSLKCPAISCPIVAIFHDFNFRYFFGALPAFNLEELRVYEENVSGWMNKAHPVVSTYFMASELEKFYPGHRYPARVIHLAPMSLETGVSRAEAEAVVRNLGIPRPYILYPTHRMPHKNIGTLLAALAKLRTRRPELRLVMTGPGTEIMRGTACEIGLERHTQDAWDTLGLGYVSDRETDALIQCASVVVSPSLYEAGCGPGVDAWVHGIPVAMSNIPAFLEHVEIQGFKAALFDPRSPEDIAERIDEILSDPGLARANCSESLKTARQLTWKGVAEQYLRVFDEAIKGHE